MLSGLQQIKILTKYKEVTTTKTNRSAGLRSPQVLSGPKEAKRRGNG